MSNVRLCPAHLSRVAARATLIKRMGHWLAVRDTSQQSGGASSTAASPVRRTPAAPTQTRRLIAKCSAQCAQRQAHPVRRHLGTSRRGACLSGVLWSVFVIRIGACPSKIRAVAYAPEATGAVCRRAAAVATGQGHWACLDVPAPVDKEAQGVTALPRRRVQAGRSVPSSALPRQTCKQHPTRFIACTGSTKRLSVGYGGSARTKPQTRPALVVVCTLVS